MEIKEQLRRVESALLDLDLLDYNTLITCIDVIESDYICKLSQLKELNENEITYLLSKVERFCENNDPIDAILEMSSIMRENTRGSVNLYKILIGKDLYQKIANKIDVKDKVGISVLGALIVRNDHLNDVIIGIGRSKFRPIASDKILVFGRIK